MATKRNKQVIVPEVTTPEVIVPEVTTPEVIVPEVTTPEVIIPEVKNVKTEIIEVAKGFDPKNRLVTLTQKGDKYTVKKSATNFSFTGTEKKANIIYNHQLICSQN